MNRRATVLRHDSPVSTGVDHNASILLADDSADNRTLIQSYLKQSGYQLDMAETGSVAVEMCKTRKYDLVLMDVQMPMMDGHTATRMIRDWEKDSNVHAIPIIALTAHAFPEEMRKSIAAGCSDHLTKPIRKDILLNTMQKWIMQGPKKPHQQLNAKIGKALVA